MQAEWRLKYGEARTVTTLFDERAIPIDSSASLADAIRNAQHAGITEMHLLRDGGPSLMWVMGDNRAMVVYWDAAEGWEDAGFHAIDPSAGDETTDEYRLANGQVDQFTDRNTISRDLVVEIAAYAYLHASRHPGVSWVDDNTGRQNLTSQ